MNERVERLQKKMQEEGLGACVISDHSAVEYFIGRRFSCGERLIALIVTTEGLPKLVLNELFPLAPQTDFELVRYNDTEDGVQIVSRFLNGKVGIDKFWSAGFLIRLMALRPDLEMVDGNLVDRIRSCLLYTSEISGNNADGDQLRQRSGIAFLQPSEADEAEGR